MNLALAVPVLAMALPAFGPVTMDKGRNRHQTVTEAARSQVTL